jgi:uncharacterized protein (DUF2147 family)
MKYTLTFIAIFFINIATFAQSSNGVLGMWITENRLAKIEVYKQGDGLFGKIVWTKIYDIKDDKNPNAKLRDKPLLGLNILTNFKNDGNNKWSNGTIYDPENGKTYSCNIQLKDGKLELRGYIGVSLFGRTSIWTRN